VYETYRRDGAGPAMRKLEVGAGLSGGPQQERAVTQSAPPPGMQEVFGRIMGSLDFFMAHGVKPISFYLPDVAALRAVSVCVIVGVGETSTGQLAQRSAVALVERPATTPVLFPGDHGGYGGQPAAFVERLQQALSAPSA
jgi:hypothetical protein